MNLPCHPGLNNSVDGGDFVHGSHTTDDLAAKQPEVSYDKYFLNIYANFNIKISINIYYISILSNQLGCCCLIP